MPFTLDSIANLDAVMQRRSQAAQAASARYACERSMAYGPDPDHTLDFYPAAGGVGQAPLLVFIHGGFWRSLRAADFSFLAAGFVEQAISVAVIDYPLIPRVRMEQVVQACRLAVKHLHSQAGALGIDAARIVVAGNSAGGHLVAELMDTGWMAPMGLPEHCLRAGVAVSGLYDLEPVARSFQNDSLQLTPQEIARYSPLMRPLALRAPLVVAVGADETGEFLRQSAEFAVHARRCGVEVQHMQVPHTHHISVVLDALASPGHALNRAACDLLA